MKTTIDRAGRVVIPAELRKKAGLRPGTLLDVEWDETAIRLVRRVARPELVRVGNRLVARPTAPRQTLPKVDVSAWIEKDRSRRP